MSTPSSRASGAIYQVSSSETPLSTYHAPPPATHGTFRAAFRDELGRGAARGLVQLIPGLIAAGIVAYGYNRLMHAYQKWRNKRQASNAKATNAESRHRKNEDCVVDVEFFADGEHDSRSSVDRKATTRTAEVEEWPPPSAMGYLPISLAASTTSSTTHEPAQKRRKRKKG